MIVDPFAGGAGGWDWATLSLGLGDPIGIEMDASACALRAATGLRTIRADVATFPLDHLPPVTGLMAGPPCQSFSCAGQRKGLLDPRGRLVYEPLRWAKALRPEWIACEQVKEVLPIWRQIRDELVALGYSAWCGALDAASYGTPQHRLRAILIASRVAEVQPPTPTHGRTGDGALWGAGVKPLVTMADALGWTGATVDTQHGNGRRFAADCGPSRSVVRASKDWLIDSGQNSRDKKGKATRYIRSVDRPAMTVATQSHSQWRLRPPGRSYDTAPRTAELTEPAPTVALGHNASSWCWERPNESIPIELWELGVLQDFPADHPWHAAGTKEAQARCIGNAIPVRLARAVLGVVAGAEAKGAAA